MNAVTEIYTKSYFFQEIVRFRECLGNKLWWLKPEAQRQLAMKALGIIYVNCENDDGSKITSEETKSLSSHLEGAFTEYERRKLLMIRFKMPMGA